MPRCAVAFRTSATITLALCLAGAALAFPPGTQQPEAEFVYHALIPLGSETFVVQPWKALLTVMASAENPQFEGWRRQIRGERSRLLDASGKMVRSLPGMVDFRVSLGTLTRVTDSEPYPITTTLSVNEYLLNVRFRVKVFHGLQQTVVMPASVALIGVPADIAYDERIYRVSFELPRLSLREDRITLEVLTPAGDRLCKFHLDLM